jgi:hypothetical protein
MSPFLYTMYEYFNNYVITKCLLSCDVLLMLIGSRQYDVLTRIIVEYTNPWSEEQTTLFIEKTRQRLMEVKSRGCLLQL